MEIIQIKYRNSNIETQNKSKILMLKIIKTDEYCFGHLNFHHLILFRISCLEFTKVYSSIMLFPAFSPPICWPFFNLDFFFI